MVYLLLMIIVDNVNIMKKKRGLDEKEGWGRGGEGKKSSKLIREKKDEANKD